MKKLIGLISRSAIVIAMLFVIFSISSSCTKDTTADLNGNGGSKNITAPKGGGTGAGSAEVIIKGTSFFPESLTVASGTTVSWRNENIRVNIVTSYDGLFGSVLSSDDTYSYTFSTAGSYKYYNRVLPSSTGIIVVN